MSLIALAGGVALYFGLQRFINLHRIVQVPRGGREAFTFVLARTVSAARDLTLGLQNGSLQRYLLLLVAMALTVGLLPFLLGATFRARAPACRRRRRPLRFAVLWFVGVAGGARDAGRVPASPARLDGARRRRPRRRAGVRLPVGAGPRADATAGRGGDRHPDDAGAELAAAGESAERSVGAAGACTRSSPARQGSAPRPLVWLVLTQPFDPISPYFLETAGPARRRCERGQRDHRRLPRLRHPGRDHRARHRGADHRGAAAWTAPVPQMRTAPARRRPSATRIR